MMRWKRIELPKGEYPPQIATKHGNGWVILQQEVVMKHKLCSVNGEFVSYIDRKVWQDVPLHIESKE